MDLDTITIRVLAALGRAQEEEEAAEREEAAPAAREGDEAGDAAP